MAAAMVSYGRAGLRESRAAMSQGQAPVMDARPVAPKGRRRWLEDVRRHLIWGTRWRRRSVLDF
jgi:hypothetical protein